MLLASENVERDMGACVFCARLHFVHIQNISVGEKFDGIAGGTKKKSKRQCDESNRKSGGSCDAEKSGLNVIGFG